MLEADDGAAPSTLERLSWPPWTGAAGFRVDRLSRQHLKQWEQIVGVVTAEGRRGQPLHPVLHHLWDTLATSRHSVYVEMPGPMSCYTSRFGVARVDPEGRAHEARLLLNLRAIDAAPTGRAAARADGFIPFKGLDRTARYAEGLGQGLAHAVWHLADPERARLALPADDRMERRAKAMAAAGLSGRAEIQESLGEPARQAVALEEAVQATEAAIWAELRASRKRRRNSAVFVYLCAGRP